MASTTTANISGTTTAKEVAIDFPPLLRVYKDGSVERLVAPHVPPSPEGDPQTGVSSKDVVFSDNPPLSARIYLPKLTTPCKQTKQKELPILVYFHGGGFYFGSMSNYFENRYITDLVSQVKCIAVCVDYRLAPEHPLPAAYDDCWAALQWVVSHSANAPVHSEPWLIDHGNFDRVYIGGDSAGGNIAHNVAMRAGADQLYGDVKILGSFLSCPYFWGSKPIGSEPVEGHEDNLYTRMWNFVFPSADDEIDSPFINPMVPGGPSLAGLGCSKLFVLVAGKDILKQRGVLYYEAVRKSGWQGEVELSEFEEEDHCFYVLQESENTKKYIKRLALFIT